jgi:hypothetical protein
MKLVKWVSKSAKILSEPEIVERSRSSVCGRSSDKMIKFSRRSNLSYLWDFFETKNFFVGKIMKRSELVLLSEQGRPMRTTSGLAQRTTLSCYSLS